MTRLTVQASAGPATRLDLVALVRSRGVPLARSDEGSWLGPCPFHEDREETFAVDPCSGRFSCSVCGSTGGVVEFVSRFDGLSRRHALELLNEVGAVFRTNRNAPVEHSTVARLQNPLVQPGETQVESVADTVLLARVADYYRKGLQENAAALRLVEHLGPRSAEAITQFGIGFVDRTLGLRIPQANRRAGRLVRIRLCRIGVLRPNGREHLRGCIVLPVPDHRGGAVAICGWRVGIVRQRPHHPLATDQLAAFLETPDTCVWNAPALDAREVILADSPFDALAFWSHDLCNVTFMPGHPAHRQALLDVLARKNIARVHLAYAATVEGESAAAKDAAVIARQGVEVMRIRFTWGMNARTFVSKGAKNSTLHDLVRSARWFGTTTHSAANTEDAGGSGGQVEEDHCATRECEPAGPRPSVDLVCSHNRLVMLLTNREYRIEGLVPDAWKGTMRCTLMLILHPECDSAAQRVLHVDRLDLLRDTCRRRFAARAADETGLPVAMIRRDLGRLLLAIEARQCAGILGGASPVGPLPGMAAPCTGTSRASLPPRTGHIRDAINGMAGQGVPFTRRDLRERFGLGATQARIHLERLVAAGFLAARRESGDNTVRYTPHPVTTTVQYDTGPVGAVGGLSGGAETR